MRQPEFSNLSIEQIKCVYVIGIDVTVSAELQGGFSPLMMQAPDVGCVRGRGLAGGPECVRAGKVRGGCGGARAEGNVFKIRF